MKKITTFLTSLLLVALACSCQSVDPKARQLADNLPVISLDDNSIDYFSADIELPELAINTYIVGKTPGDYAIKQTDSNGRPFLYGANGKVIIYNPIDDSFVIFNGSPHGEINLKKKLFSSSFNMSFGFKSVKVEDGEDGQSLGEESVNLDIKSLFKGRLFSTNLTVYTGNAVRLRRITKKAQLDAFFTEINNPLSLQNINIYIKDKKIENFPKEPFISIKNIKINTTAESMFPEVPVNVLKSTGLKITDLTNVEDDDLVNQLQSLIQISLMNIVLSSQNPEGLEELNRITGLDSETITSRSNNALDKLKSIISGITK
ncbi:MAG: hypothetical protein QF721_08700 [Verrucomicrobiota bacterium]|jgi:hypothetical protein|nr:hypothetical protein [Verrucomicrobiota bacterium]